MGAFTTAQYLIVYGSVVLAIILFAQIRIFSFVAMTMRASANLHDDIYRKLIVTVMRFFDTNPSGEQMLKIFIYIYNIESKEIDQKYRGWFNVKK